MNRQLTTKFSLIALTFLVCLAPTASAEEKIKLFNGKDLDGWKGNMEVWSVQDGMIVGSSVGKELKTNTFLVWQGGEPSDFRLTFKARLEGENNSGVQYRSKVDSTETWEVVGYQADIHSKPEYTFMLYGEGTGRSIIAERGSKAVIETDSSKSKIDKQAFDTKPVDLTQWHEFTITAKGNHLVHELDGKTTLDLVDNHEKQLLSGILALQVHRGKPMTVYFKDLTLEKLSD